MDGVIERSGKWYATFRINGTTKRVNTGVPIEQKGRKASQLEAEARQKAAVLEQRAKGLMNHSAALDALRNVERINGAGGNIPTVRKYLTNYRGQATEKTEKNKKRAAKMFLEYLGKGVDIRLDALTRQTVQDFIPWALQRVAVGTAAAAPTLWSNNITGRARPPAWCAFICSCKSAFNRSQAAASTITVRFPARPFTVQHISFSPAGI